MSDLLDHGRDAKLPAHGVELKGSPILERLASGLADDSAYFRIGSHKKNAVLKLELVDRASHVSEQADDVVGHVSFGCKSLTFDGAACGGLLGVSFTGGLEDDSADPTFNLTMNFDRWEGRDLRYLPHFEKLLRFFERLAAGCAIDIGLEIEGLVALRAKAHLSAAESDTIRSTNGILQYIARVRRIVDHLCARVTFVAENTITEDDFLQVVKTLDIMEGRLDHDASVIEANPTCEMIAENGGENVRALASGALQSNVFFVHPAQAMMVFGQSVPLPSLEVALTGVRPKVWVDVAAVKDGDVVLVEWQPLDGFRCSFRYHRHDKNTLAQVTPTDPLGNVAAT